MRDDGYHGVMTATAAHGMPVAAFLGRWQPFHKGHEMLIRRKLDQGIPVLILIKNMAPDATNPYTAQEAASMVRVAFVGESTPVHVLILPDIESVNWGRAVGYETNEHVLPPDVQHISATEIRQRMARGDHSWKQFVSPPVARWLEARHAS
jgi:nicotinamide mononucleotide adenylyltransferase